MRFFFLHLILLWGHEVTVASWKRYLSGVDRRVLGRADEDDHGDKLHHLRDGAEALRDSWEN